MYVVKVHSHRTFWAVSQASQSSRASRPSQSSQYLGPSQSSQPSQS